MEKLISKHGGYRELKTFQLARLVYDITLRFCDRYVQGRTHDQMVQAARSGVQNIAEGSQASGTSKKTELKLTNVARASLEELKLDYEDFLRQREMMIWARNDARRQKLIDQRLSAADQFAFWAKDTAAKHEEIPTVAANGVLVLLSVTCALLDRQLEAQADAFKKEGGFTERLYRVRSQERRGRESVDTGRSGPKWT